MNEPAAELTLHEAADRLGVHYMTAYRYVRHGQLPAEKRGGVWRVRVDDLDRFREVPAPAARPRIRRAPWAERLEARLMAGDERGSWGVIEAALASGYEVTEIYLDVLSPAMVSIGARWEVGEVDISVEHRATAIAQRLIGRLGPRCVRRGRSRGTVVVGAPAGETHGLPVAILADLVRAEGWEVIDLGADTPASSFAQVVADVVDVAAVGVSITHGDHLDLIAEIVAAVRSVSPDVPVFVGGAAVGGEAEAVARGADGWARSAADLSEMVERHRRRTAGRATR